MSWDDMGWVVCFSYRRACLAKLWNAFWTKKTRINKGFWGVILLVIGLVVKRNILYDLWLWSVWDGLSNAVLYDNIGAWINACGLEEFIRLGHLDRGGEGKCSVPKPAVWVGKVLRFFRVDWQFFEVAFAIALHLSLFNFFLEVYFSFVF